MTTKSFVSKKGLWNDAQGQGGNSFVGSGAGNARRTKDIFDDSNDEEADAGDGASISKNTGAKCFVSVAVTVQLISLILSLITLGFVIAIWKKT
jgi:hypothetical protein